MFEIIKTNTIVISIFRQTAFLYQFRFLEHTTQGMNTSVSNYFFRKNIVCNMSAIAISNSNFHLPRFICLFIKYIFRIRF